MVNLIHAHGIANHRRQHAKRHQIGQRIQLNPKFFLPRRPLPGAGHHTVEHIAQPGQHQANHRPHRFPFDDEGHPKYRGSQAQIGQNDRVIVISNHRLIPFP